MNKPLNFKAEEVSAVQKTRILKLFLETADNGGNINPLQENKHSANTEENRTIILACCLLRLVFMLPM